MSDRNHLLINIMDFFKFKIVCLATRYTRSGKLQLCQNFLIHPDKHLLFIQVTCAHIYRYMLTSVIHHKDQIWWPDIEIKKRPLNILSNLWQRGLEKPEILMYFSDKNDNETTFLTNDHIYRKFSDGRTHPYIYLKRPMFQYFFLKRGSFALLSLLKYPITSTKAESYLITYVRIVPCNSINS